MKTNEITRILGFALAAIVTGLLFSGCATEYQAYSGPYLPPEQIAILKVPWHNGAIGGAGTTFLSVSGIDETRPPVKSVLIRLLPGKHTISFMFMQSGTGYYSSAPIHKDVYLEAGKTYTASLVIHSPTWDVEIRPEN